MTHAELYYTGEWEYKTVHSRKGEFGSPYHLQRLIRQESMAGWTLVEQFGSGSVRFRRPVIARTRDYLLPQGVDPYRTMYTYTASPESEILSLIILAALVFIALTLMIGTVILFSPPG